MLMIKNVNFDVTTKQAGSTKCSAGSAGGKRKYQIEN